MPEAMSQALAVSEIPGRSITPFCLTNGRSWIFAVLKTESNGQRAYYAAQPFYLDRVLVEMRHVAALRSIQEIVELHLEWASLCTKRFIR